MAGRARRQSGGSIRRLKSGRWQARVRERATGRYVTLGTFVTKADADAALTTAKRDVLHGGFVAPERGRVTLAEYADDGLEHHPTLAPSTRNLYRNLLDRHLLPHLGGAALGDIEPTTIERWYGTLGTTTTPGQRAKAYRLMRTVLNHAVKNQRIVRNPCMIDKGGHESTPERPVATIPQVLALAEAMPERLRAAVLIAAFGSLRVGEVAGLRREDVEMATGRVRVVRQVQRLGDGRMVVKEPKAGSQRTVTLPPQVMEVLAEHLKTFTGPDPEDYVFTRPRGSPLHHLYVNRFWRDARTAVAAEDPTLPKDLHFHDLRGTGATLATAEGASLKEVMNRLGHRSTRAALIYQHATEDRDKAIAGLLGKAIDQAKG